MSELLLYRNGSHGSKVRTVEYFSYKGMRTRVVRNRAGHWEDRFSDDTAWFDMTGCFNFDDDVLVPITKAYASKKLKIKL